MNWTDYDQPTLDAEYDNQRTVADYAAVIAEWQAASEAARRRTRTLPDIAYGEHPRARIDVYPATGSGEAVIFFHGGFWRSFDKTGLAFLAPAFVQAGVTLIMPNYPLAPEADFATIVRHAGDAAAWIMAHAAGFGIDPSKTWIAGHSAGAHLAVTTAVARGSTTPRFAGCLAISGIYDLAPVRQSYLNGSLHLTENDVAAFSPITTDNAGTRLLTAVGDRETREFRRQTAALVDRWRSLGGACEHVALSDTDHYEAVRRLAWPGDALFARVIAAIRNRPPA